MDKSTLHNFAGLILHPALSQNTYWDRGSFTVDSTQSTASIYFCFLRIPWAEMKLRTNIEKSLNFYLRAVENFNFKCKLKNYCFYRFLFLSSWKWLVRKLSLPVSKSKPSVLIKLFLQKASDRVDISYATETVDRGSIPGRVKPKIIKLVFTAFVLDAQQLKGKCEAFTVCAVDRWEDSSLSQSCKTGRAFRVGFGPKVGKNFGHNSGLKRTFCLRCTNLNQNNLATLLNFSDLT